MHGVGPEVERGNRRWGRDADFAHHFERKLCDPARSGDDARCLTENPPRGPSLDRTLSPLSSLAQAIATVHVHKVRRPELAVHPSYRVTDGADVAAVDDVESRTPSRGEPARPAQLVDEAVGALERKRLSIDVVLLVHIERFS